jgi:hypothetical protein
MAPKWFNVGCPIKALYEEGQSTKMNLTVIVLALGFFLKVTIKSTYHFEIIVSPVKPIRLPL